MKDDKPKDFRFRMSVDSPQADVPEMREEKGFKKLKRRVAWISILFPVMLVLAAIYIYQDLKKGVTTIRDTDVVAAQALAKTFDSKFSSLSIQMATLEESLTNIQKNFENLEASYNQKVKPLDEIYLVFEKTTSALKEELSRTQTSLDRLAATKSDKSELSQAVATLEKKISPVYQHLKNMESEIKALDENLTQELAELSGTIYKVKNDFKQIESIKKEINKINELKKQVSSIASSQIDPKTLSVITHQQKQITTDINALKAELKKRSSRLETLEDHVQELLKFKAISEIKKRLEPEPTPQSSSPPSAPLKPEQNNASIQPSKPVTGETPPPRGTILEETIR